MKMRPDNFMFYSMLIAVSRHFVVGSKIPSQCPDRNKVTLFTPGPVKTSKSVREAMGEDMGLSEQRYLSTVQYIRKSTLQIANASEERYTVILMQGSGTYGIESAIQTATPKNDKGRVLVISNGYFGNQLVKICKHMHIPYKTMNYNDGEEIDLEELKDLLIKDEQFSTVAVVHHETSSGIINPIGEIEKLMQQYLPNAALIIDAISSFICIPIDFSSPVTQYVVFTLNKCLQGLSGYSITIANKQHLLTTEGNSHSLSMDLYDQYSAFEKTDNFRFTSPIQVLLATKEAMRELFLEGINNRRERILLNSFIVRTKFAELGFKPFLKDEVRSSVVTAYYMPKNFDFITFQSKLQEQGFFIYAKSVTKVQLFRVSHIGDINAKHCRNFLTAVDNALREMKVKIPIKE